MSDAKQLGAAIQRTGDVMVKVGTELQGESPDVASLAGELTATAEALTAAAAPKATEEVAEETKATEEVAEEVQVADESVAAPAEKKDEEEDLEGLAAMGISGGKKKKKRGGKSQRVWKKKGGRQTKKRRNARR
jgi:hypothetical protein